MSPNLLVTKLFFPPVRENLVPRPRLVEKVARGLRSPLLLISAPAGSGKTTLLAEWHSNPESRMPVAWLTLDNEDNDLSRFLLYLATALGTLKAGIGDSLIAILQSPQPLPPQVAMTALINDLTDSLPTPFSLVLDDYHVLISKQVHTTVTFLLDHLPPQMHLVILTRADPPLPLPSLRARNQLAELRAADLRFTLEEAATFLNTVMGLKLPIENIVALEERTEGWISGLQLAGLSMQGREDMQEFVSAFTGSNHFVVDYLVEEVFNRQPEAMREFLLKTSILDRLTAPLCNALTNQTNGQVVLDSLEHANLFVIPLDDEQRWYRYHYLFADAIRNRLLQTQPEWIPSLHRHAAEWYEQNGFVADAIRHALAAEEIDKAARLIERNAQPMLMRRELITLANWLKAVEEQLDKRPRLCVYQAWVLFFTGQMSDLERYLQKAEQLVSTNVPTDGVGQRDILGQIAAIRTGVAFIHGDADRAIDLARQALEYLPEGNFEARAIVTYALGGAFWLRGDIIAAGNAFGDLERNGRAAGNMPVVVMALCSLARLRALKGQLRHAAAIFREAIQLATSQYGQLLPIAAEACAGLGHILYEWNDLDAAADYIKKYAEISQFSGVISYKILSQVLLARLYLAKGESDKAFDLLYLAERLAERSTLGIDTDTRFAAYRINIRLDGGDQESAVRIAIERGLGLEDTGNWRREPEYIAFVRVLLAQDEYDKALTLVEKLIYSAESGGLFGYVVELLPLQALIFYAKGAFPQALGILERSLSFAQPEGYIRTFVDNGALMADLLHQARSHSIVHKYVSKLLSEFDMMRVPSIAVPTNQSIFEPLSERELEILRLVAWGKSNQQIADELIIARGTVKKHLNNIFGKLGVQSRTQCVAQARELKLL